MSAFVIKARGLTKTYGDHVAVDHLDLDVAPGEIFGLLGPNGAGKTTTILMIMGLTDVSDGSIEVLGLNPSRDPLAVKRHVGYMPDMVGFYDHLTARENLAYTGRLAGLDAEAIDRRIKEVLERVELSDVENRGVGTFSRGMRQRLGLADALLKNPRIVILDEPTSGMDPHATNEFLALLRDLKADGISCLLSSHLLERVQEICDRVALFHRGRIVLRGTVEELAKQVLGSGHRIEVVARGKGLRDLFAHVPGVIRVRDEGGDRFTLEAESDVRPAVAARVAASDCQLFNLATRQASLDTVYRAYFEEDRHAA